MTITRNVRDLVDSDRSAVERVVGHSLGEHQQLVIQIVSEPAAAESDPPPVPSDELPWGNFYAGLSDEEIDRIDQAIRYRCRASRNFE